MLEEKSYWTLLKRISQKLFDLDTESQTHHRADIDLINWQRSGEGARNTGCTQWPHDWTLCTCQTSHLCFIAFCPWILSCVSSLTARSHSIWLLQLWWWLPPSSDVSAQAVQRENKRSKQQDTLQNQVFDCSVKIEKLLSPACTKSESSTLPSKHKGVRLPKLAVPTFDGNRISFWKQFRILVHDSEKLVYLQQSLKGGTAKSTIEGLSLWRVLCWDDRMHAYRHATTGPTSYTKVMFAWS